MTMNGHPLAGGEGRLQNIAILVALALIVGGVLTVLMSTGAVAATNNTTTTNTTNLNETAPYYDNQSSSVNSSAWFAGYRDVSLTNVTGMLTRLGPYVIGTGPKLPGGVGFAGPIVLGLVVAGVFVGATAGAGIGMEGGAVVSMVAAYGLIKVGLAPEWLKVVVLMLLGLVTAVVFLRAR